MTPSNSFYQVSLRQGEYTELIFSHLLAPPTGRVACVTFRYRKYSTGRAIFNSADFYHIPLTDGAMLPLHLISWPYQSSPTKVSIIKNSSNTNTWVKAKIMLRNLDKKFVLMLRASVGAGSLYIAVDDIKVIGGECGRGRRAEATRGGEFNL